MALSRRDIVDAFEMILGRTPDDSLINYHAGLGFNAQRELVDYFLKTEEFRDRYEGFVAQGLAPPSRAAGGAGSARPVTVFLGDRVMTQTHRGHKIYAMPTDVDLAPHLMTSGSWEAHVERAVVSQLRPGGIAADIGANIGYHTLAMASAVGHAGRIHAFEANPELVPLLRASIFVNGFADFVTLHHKAVMDRPGRIVLALSPHHFGSGNVVPPSRDGHYDADYSRRHEVEGATLDSMLAEVPALDMIRIDIEGSEPQALRGAEGILRRSPGLGIVAEWSVGMMSARSDVEAFIDWLDDAGFGFWLISPTGDLFRPLDPSALTGLPHSDLFISRQGPA